MNIMSQQQQQYEQFPQACETRSSDPKFTQGRNKSGRAWKQTSKTTHWTRKVGQRTWEEKCKQAKQMKELREGIKIYKAKRISKRKEIREQRKVRKQQKEYNAVKSGKYEVVKNLKNMKKWSKKVKAQLVKLPAEMFQNLLRKQ